MYFEAKVIDNPNLRNDIVIEEISNNWARDERIDCNTFRFALDYFRNRYVDEGTTNDSFNDLFQRGRRDEVSGVLCCEDQQLDKQRIALAILLIVHRIRNNLLHGNKLRQLPDQFENFVYANRVLKLAIKIWSQH